MNDLSIPLSLMFTDLWLWEISTDGFKPSHLFSSNPRQEILGDDALAETS